MFTAEKIAKEAAEQALAKGLTRGRAEGRAEQLLKVLTVRFGPLPVELAVRVRAADEAQLDHLTVLAVTAGGLDAVIAG